MFFSLYLLTTGRFRTHDNKKKHYLYEYLLVMFLFVTTQIRWLFEHSIALEMRTPQYPLLVMPMVAEETTVNTPTLRLLAWEYKFDAL